MPIELAMWANLQAEYSGWVILGSGILGSAVNFRTNEIAGYAILASLFIIVFEWPRSKRQKGTNMPRWNQNYIEVILQSFGIFARNYFIRFIIYLLVAIPLFFLLPTMLAGMCLFCASITYFAAALRGEQWVPISGGRKPATAAPRRTVTADAPAHPPPRAPQEA